MIYGYLADTALAPLGKNNSTYQVYSTNGTGVGQVTERVMSMLNATKVGEGTTADDPTPGIIVDPRTLSSNNRLANRFSGQGIPTQLRPSGTMSIHYDRYLAYQDAAGSSDLAGNYIDKVLVDTGDAAKDRQNLTEITLLFSVIETITMSHIYDINSGVWEYRTKDVLETALSSYSTAAKGSYGYVKNTLEISSMTGTDKTAKVRNVSNESSTVVDTLGSDPVASKAPVYFPDSISFSFKFSALSAPSSFRLYLNPEAMLKNYERTTITHVVMPLAPEDLCTPGFVVGKTSLETLDLTSAYVANMLSGTTDDGSTHDVVYNSDTLKNTNYTGSVARSTAYMDRSSNVKFACIYKGRTPTTFECYHAINTALVNRLMEKGMTETVAQQAVLDAFPDMLSSEQYTIVPFYDSLVVSAVANSYTYARNVFSLAYINRILKKFQSSAANYDAYTTLIGIPGYDMHAIAISPEDTSEAGLAPLFSEKGLDSNEEFSSYQPLSATDTRWNTMTNEAKRLAEYLSIIVGSEIMGTAISSTSVSYTIEEQTIAGVRCKMYVFTVGSATFFVMQKSSYLTFVSENNA